MRLIEPPIMPSALQEDETRVRDRLMSHLGDLINHHVTTPLNDEHGSLKHLQRRLRVKLNLLEIVGEQASDLFVRPP